MTSSTEAEGHKKSKLKGTKIIDTLIGGQPPCREGTIKLIGTIDTPICWPDVKKHRLLLSDAFDLTCGRQLKHAQLCKQLAKWTSTHASTVAAFESLFLYQDVPHRGRLQGLQGQLTKEPSCRLKF